MTARRQSCQRVKPGDDLVGAVLHYHVHDEGITEHHGEPCAGSCAYWVATPGDPVLDALLNSQQAQREVDTKRPVSHPVPTPTWFTVRRRRQARDGVSAVGAGVVVGVLAGLLSVRRPQRQMPRGADA